VSVIWLGELSFVLTVNPFYCVALVALTVQSSDWRFQYSEGVTAMERVPP